MNIDRINRINGLESVPTDEIQQLRKKVEEFMDENSKLRSTIGTWITHSDKLSLQVQVLRGNLTTACERMNLARDILTDGNPRPMCNWGMLDTSDLDITPNPDEWIRRSELEKFDTGTTDREAFEKWFETQYSCKPKEIDGIYQTMFARGAWKGFQAATLAERERITPNPDEWIRRSELEKFDTGTMPFPATLYYIKVKQNE